MELKLYERRSNNLLVTNAEVRQTMVIETTCMHCRTENSVDIVGLPTKNANNLIDERGIPMMDQPVSCGKCGEKWVDVFCRVYPSED